MAVTLKTLGNLSGNDPEKLVAALRQILNDLEDQLNTRAQVYTSVTGQVPNGLLTGDVLINDSAGTIAIGVQNAKGIDYITAEMIGGMSPEGLNFKGFQQGVGAPSTTQFPNNADWGFYNNTAGPTFSFCYNLNGVVKKVNLT